jgi:hypothetical protein
MCKSHLQRSLELSENLLREADAIVHDCPHDGCLFLAGLLRDSGLKLRSATMLVQEEMNRNVDGGPEALQTLARPS